MAPPEGGAAQLGGSADRRVLEEALAWCDGALVGAETIRRHGTTCLIHGSELLADRRRQGRPDQPAALVASRSGDLSPGLAFWQQPLQRWWLAAAPTHPPTSAPPAGFDQQLVIPSWEALRPALAAAGFGRVVLLGGADLVSQLLQADALDELQLTLTPRVLGGPHSWCRPEARVDPSRWQLHEQRCLYDGELLLRYRRIPCRPRQTIGDAKSWSLPKG